MRVVRGIATERKVRPASIVAVGVLAYIAVVLALDPHTGYAEQIGVGCTAIAVLLSILRFSPVEDRVQILIVVAVASCFEVLGSIIWGVYRYRLGNVPLFVPPGHGLVYFAGLSFARVDAIRRRSRLFVLLAFLGGCAWAGIGLSGLIGPRDVCGAIGIVVFSVMLWRSRTPLVLAMVFVIVGALELYGTRLGVWRWTPVVRGLGIPQGNPPSGAISGYALFDLAAFSAAGWVARLARSTLALRRARPRAGEVAPSTAAGS